MPITDPKAKEHNRKMLEGLVKLIKQQGSDIKKFREENKGLSEKERCDKFFKEGRFRHKINPETAKRFAEIRAKRHEAIKEAKAKGSETTNVTASKKGKTSKK